jgi:hypothetical protein
MSYVIEIERKKEGEKERKEEGKEQDMRCTKHVEVMQSQ